MKVKSESKVVQSCLTLSDPMDCSPPGSSVHGIFQSRVLEWVACDITKAINSSCVYAWSLSCVHLFVTPWTVVRQAHLSFGILQVRTLKRVAMSSSRGSSQSRDWTQASHIVDRFFTVWATREALSHQGSPSISYKILEKISKENQRHRDSGGFYEASSGGVTQWNIYRNSSLSLFLVGIVCYYFLKEQLWHSWYFQICLKHVKSLLF